VFKVFSLINSTLRLVAARTICFGRKGVKSVIIGSNYGDSFDPNVFAAARAFKQAGYAVIVVNHRNDSVQLYKYIDLILVRGTWQSFKQFWLASVVVYTHSLSDVIPFGHKLSMFLVGKRPSLIFMQHGMIGLKAEVGNGRSIRDYLKSLVKTFDRIVVSSTKEASLVSQLGIP